MLVDYCLSWGIGIQVAVDQGWSRVVLGWKNANDPKRVLFDLTGLSISYPLAFIGIVDIFQVLNSKSLFLLLLWIYNTTKTYRSKPFIDGEYVFAAGDSYPDGC